MNKRVCVLALAVASGAVFAQNQNSTYQSAVQNYTAGQYEQSCSDFKQIYTASNKLQNVDETVVQAEKSSGLRGFDWQKKAFESDRAQAWAKECAEWYHAALREEADQDAMLVGNDLEYAQRAEKHLVDEQGSAGAARHGSAGAKSPTGTAGMHHPASTAAAGTGCASDDAMQKSVRLVFPCVDVLLHQARAAKQAGQAAQARATYQRLLQVNGYAGFQRSYDVDKEARDYLNQADAASQSQAMKAGTGTIPSGTYKCYAATTATVLAGGSARLNPGNWGGDIEIKGDTYLYGSNPWGRYKVGANGKITWMDGGYSEKTLGRYIVDNGAPTIVIGWADTDAGQVCKQ